MKREAAFDVGNLKTSFPYFLCVKPRAGKLNLFTEGKGNRMRIEADCIDDCTAVVSSARDVEKIKTAAAAIGETVTEAS